MTDDLKEKLQERADCLYAAQVESVYRRTDRLFGYLLFFEWVAGIFIALLVSPEAWNGAQSTVHPHVWIATVLGGLIVGWPVYLSAKHPGKAITRHSVGIGQMLYAALFIHLTGGRIESHFLIFGSLAFLSFYRDWRVLVSASVIVAADHILRGILYPQSVYGVSAVEPWRWLEHAWWVVFEDFFLINSCLENRAEMRQNALRQAEIEITRDGVEQLVDERTRQLQDSQSDNKQLAFIVQSASEAIVGLTLEGAITSWNKGAELLFDYSSEEVLGQPASMLVPREAMDVYLKNHALNREGSVVDNQETLCLTKLGETVEVLQASFPIFDEGGRIVGTSVFLRDITERKAAEKRVSEFYSIVSHELRTPLTSIRGALGLIEGGIVAPDSEQMMELITVARSSSDRLIRLINDMLDLKKIEAGKMEFTKRKISALEVMIKSVESLEGMAEESGVKLRCLARNDQAFVHADWDKIIQLLINLGSNAIKFSQPGKEVSFDVLITEERMVRFSVTDSGCGIADDDKARLFDKFQQLDSSDTRQKGGTGLGLAICRALVEQHGGTIGLDSVVGKGSTFWFDLPKVTKPIVTLSQKQSLIERSRGTILLVEDDDELADVISTLIEHQGYRFVRSATLAEARDHLTEIVPDVVILDLTLPDGQGLELLELLKTNPDTCDTPVIVSTGQQKNESMTGNATVVDWLMKPFDMNKLTGAVERALKVPGRCKVLVVDDDSDTRKVLSTQLTAHGLKCIEAKDGLEAIYLTRKEAPDIIVLDVQMNNLDGFQVVEVLKNEDARSTPLVIYSGRDLTSEDRDALTLGVTKYLTKSGNSQWELSATIDELLGGVLSGNSVKLGK